MNDLILTVWMREEVPEMLTMMRSRRMCCVQLGTNLGMRGCDPRSSLSLSWAP